MCRTLIECRGRIFFAAVQQVVRFKPLLENVSLPQLIVDQNAILKNTVRFVQNLLKFYGLIVTY